MKTWNISNSISGADLGNYDGETAVEALNTMNDDAGATRQDEIPEDIDVVEVDKFQTSLVSAVEDAHTAASGGWIGRDWECHRAIMVEQRQQELDRAKECEDDTELEEEALAAATAELEKYDAEIETAAKDAEERAAEAVDYARKGDWNNATFAANAAADYERAYGDTPVWGGFSATVEIAAKLAEALAEDEAEDARELLGEAEELLDEDFSGLSDEARGTLQSVWDEIDRRWTAQITTRGAICDEPLSVGDPAEEIVLLGGGQIVFQSRRDDELGESACRRWADENGWNIEEDELNAAIVRSYDTDGLPE